MRSALRQIMRVGGQELLWLADFHRSEHAVEAILPNLDGLYGGKACKRNVDNSKFVTKCPLHLITLMQFVRVLDYKR